MKSVNVFLRLDGFDNFMLRNMPGQWQLDNKSVNPVIFIKFFYPAKQFTFTYIVFISYQ